MEVYVVMGNDFPAAVFEAEGDAEAYCVARRAEHKHGYTRIYWRVYNFPILRAVSVDTPNGGGIGPY